MFYLLYNNGYDGYDVSEFTTKDEAIKFIHSNNVSYLSYLDDFTLIEGKEIELSKKEVNKL